MEREINLILELLFWSNQSEKNRDTRFLLDVDNYFFPYHIELQWMHQHKQTHYTEELLILGGWGFWSLPTFYYN